MQRVSIHRHTCDVINVSPHGLHKQKIANDRDKKETVNRSRKVSQAVNQRLSAQKETLIATSSSSYV